MSEQMVRLKKGSNPIVTQMILAGAVAIVGMVFGILMLMVQGGWMDLSPARFYQFLTIHGTFMIGAAALAASAILWYFLNHYVRLSKGILKANLILFLISAVMVTVGVFSFEYASGWTFLYPLPALAANAWGTIGALLYLVGMLILGIGFLLIFIDTGRGIIKTFGSLGKGLGWDVLSGKKAVDDAPPPTVVASTMATIVTIAALLTGATVLVMNIINVINPSFTFDPLLAKNFTYAFGHIFANATIYMGVIVVYELLARYTKRPWKSSKIFLVFWTMSTVFTLLVYPHHLLMDTVMPRWILIMGQVLSYANGLPVLVITAYGALMIVYKSGIKWDMASGLAFISMLGWTIGVIPAIVDSAIVVNHVMHNTKWVPGHFHMYMGLGVLAMMFSFMYFLVKKESSLRETIFDRAAYYVYMVAMIGLSVSFLLSGAMSTPRRWATHLPEWMGPAQFGAIAGGLVVLAVSLFTVHFIRFLILRSKQRAGRESGDTEVA